MPDLSVSLSILVHAEAKVGKSWLANTAPAPRLILDAEGGTRFLKGKKVLWDPHKEAPPAAGDWETCVVYVRSYETVHLVYKWLVSGEHPFISLAIDSVTEVQKRCKDALTGADRRMEQQDWGDLLSKIEDLVRKLRDLTFHPTKPLTCVVLVALTKMREGKFRPMVQGALAESLPGFPDVVGFMYTETSDVDGTKRKLAIQPVWPTLLAGDRTDLLTEHYGPIITNPNLTEMISVLNQEES